MKNLAFTLFENELIVKELVALHIFSIRDVILLHQALKNS